MGGWVRLGIIILLVNLLLKLSWVDTGTVISVYPGIIICKSYLM